MSLSNIFAEMLERVRAASEALIVAGVLPQGIDQSRITVEPPRDTGHGDMATNAAMVLAKDAGRKPRDLAELIAEKLRSDSLVAKIEIAGPGFINLTLRPAAWLDALQAAVRLGRDYGRSDIGDGAPVNVEYVSANPTLAAEYGESLAKQSETSWLPVVRDKAVAMMMDGIRADLAALNVKPDVFYSERSLFWGAEDQVEVTIESLRARGYVYEGRLPPPKGAPAEDWEDREQTLFRSTSFGDDIDRPLKKSDGSYTYFASDIAYHRSKLERGFRTLIDVWGADHGGYIKRMQAAVAALSDRRAQLDVKIVQLVKLLRAGEPVKMSKRAGEFVTLREVVDEVGRDAVRFMMLFRKNDAVLDFDLVKVLEQSRDNPVFYVQYGHARAQSVFRNARTAFPDIPEDIAKLAESSELARLSDPAELALMRQIALYPRILSGAASTHEPHRIAFYLFDLASEFHALWTQGNASPHLRFIIQNDRQLTEARLVLVQGVAAVLASGLALLGVEAPNEM
jgi:arginyl-tRNA synthetase